MRFPTFAITVLGLLAFTSATANEMASRDELGAQESSRTQSIDDGMEVKRQEETYEYVFYPKDGTDEAALSKTEAEIKNVTGLAKVYSYRDVNNVLRLWTADVTKAQLDVLEKFEGFDLVHENIDEDKVLLVASSRVRSVGHDLSTPNKVKRNLDYTTQLQAPSDLVMISQPTTVPDLDDVENYVFEDHAGDNVYIYHIENGIAASKLNEFPPDQLEFLQSQASKDKGQRKKEDDSEEYSHSTYTAAKAMSRTYGSAKKAILVVVKINALRSSELDNVFDAVWQQIKSKQRQKRSVVTISFSSKKPVDPNNQPRWRTSMQNDIATLMKNDVIVVTGSGNDAEEKDVNGNKRPNIDTAPSVYEGPDYPIITVGASDYTGQQGYFSQGGPKLTILAPGVDVPCLDKASDTPLYESGTSLAAPLVAGVLASFLAYDQVPFDLSDSDRSFVQSAKKYLQDTANWERQAGVPVIWNLVDEDHNPKKPETTTIAAASTSTMATPTPTPVAPYAQGTCSIHITQQKLKNDGNYFMGVTMADNDGTQIGQGAGGPVSDSKPLEVQSKLEDTLWCKPEQHNDYIAFALGDQAWPSDGDFADGDVPSCSVGGWDGGLPAKRQMDCVFVCGWGGGPASDGSN